MGWTRILMPLTRWDVGCVKHTVIAIKIPIFHSCCPLVQLQDQDQYSSIGHRRGHVGHTICESAPSPHPARAFSLLPAPNVFSLFCVCVFLWSHR